MNYKVWTDGSVWPNPGPGGWAAIIEDEIGYQEQYSGHLPDTTTNRAETIATLSALQTVWGREDTGRVELFTDSSYVVHIVREIKQYQARGFWLIPIEDRPNQDLILELHKWLAGRQLLVIKIPGHAGVRENERVDRMAQAARKGGHTLIPLTTARRLLLRKELNIKPHRRKNPQKST